MTFNNNVPEWKNEGSDPPDTLKEEGFTAGYKPPAAYFNWFFNRIQKSVKEIQEKLSNELKAMAFKEDIGGEDISETVIETLDMVEDKFPVPVAGESVKRFFGKVLTFLRNIKPLTENINIYVSTTGSDITGDGTVEKPFKTITYALNSLPRDFNGYDATITVSAGTYDEDILFLGYGVNGTLTISLTGNITVNSIYMENSNVIFRSSVVSVARTLSTKYVLITNASSINAYSDVYVTTTGYYQDGTTKISIYIIRQSFAYFSGNTTLSGNTDTAIAISNTSSAYFYSTYGSGFGTGFSVSTGAKLTIYNSSLSATQLTAVWAGGQIIHSNGTQISNLITGLSCTWGNGVDGGYHRNGNLNGTAQVIVNLRIVTMTPLTAGQQYFISGFPTTGTTSSTVAVTVHNQEITAYSYLNEFGHLIFAPKINLSTGFLIIFSCTYITNS